jgi:hypothetical protein
MNKTIIWDVLHSSWNTLKITKAKSEQLTLFLCFFILKTACRVVVLVPTKQT